MKLRRHWFLSNLSRQFREYGCTWYLEWVGGSTKAPPRNPTPEEEEAALHAVIDWLKPVPDDPSLCEEPGKAGATEAETRSGPCSEAKERLRQQDRVAGAEAEDHDETASPFDHFGPKMRQLLNYLWDKGRRPHRSIPTIMQMLGFTTASMKNKRAFSQLMCRANNALTEMKDKPRYEIEKDKEENTIYLFELPT
jgi:hypothetical protein